MTSVGEVSRFDVVFHVVSTSDTLENTCAAANYDRMLTTPNDFSDQVGAILVHGRKSVVYPERATSYHHFMYEIACIYAIDGNVPEAMKWLRESAEKGNPSYTLFARDPFLDKIRQSPEFIEFMAELKLDYDKYRSEFH